jgi:hypothetical protein
MWGDIMDNNPKTLKIRLAVAIDSKKNWNVKVAGDDRDPPGLRPALNHHAVESAREGMSSGVNVSILIADLPVPDPEKPIPEIVASVESVS